MKWTMSDLSKPAAVVIGNEPQSPSDDVVQVDGYHIHFYSDVTHKSAYELMIALRDADAGAQYDRVRNGGVGWSKDESFMSPNLPLWLHVHSPGGFLLPALGIVDAIGHMKTPVHSVIEGYAASAATLIAMACHKRFITRSSFMLLHQLSGGIWGTYEQMKDSMKMNDLLMAQVVRFYEERSVLDETAVREILARDSWFSATDCKENGFVDEVIE